MPTRRGWRTHQKASTSATKSGTTRMSGHGRKLRNSASANEATMVLARTGIRICDLAGSIGFLRVFRLGARLARLVAAAVLDGLLGQRRARRLVGEDEHIATALD